MTYWKYVMMTVLAVTMGMVYGQGIELKTPALLWADEIWLWLGYLLFFMHYRLHNQNRKKGG